MPWTVQKTWVVGETLTAADLNTYVRDALNWLYAGPAVHVRRAAAQSITNATLTTVSFDTELRDVTDNMWAVALPTRVTTPNSAKGLMTYTVHWAANATGQRYLEIAKNGTGQANGVVRVQSVTVASTPTVIAGAGYFEGAPGDYFELRVYQDSGGALNVTDAYLAYLALGANSSAAV